MKLLTHFSRLFVGILFIVSGLIKLNDPVGFSFKLEEYFGRDVLNLEFLIPYALILATGIVIFEVLLGVMLLVGFKKKFTVWSLLLMIGFFTFLTFYSAYFNKVTDCGCFGDAVKLTPWQSFYKDIILLFFILILFFNQRYIQPVFNKRAVSITVFMTLVLCGFLAYHVLNHLPVIDFRAYKEGTNIKQGMSIPEGAPRSEYEMIFIYNVNGKLTEFTDKELDKIPEGAEFADRKDKLIKQGYEPPIYNFTIEKDGEDHTDAVLEEPKVVMFISYNLEKAKPAGLAKLNALHKKAEAKGYKVIGMTSSTDEVISQVKQQYNFDFDYYFCDGTTLKTIERANPSIVVLKKGTINQKVHWNDIDDLILD